MTPHHQPRGSVLLFSVVTLAILTLLAAGAIQFTAHNRMAASARARAGRTTACAETARAHLLSRLRLFRMPVTELTLAEPLPDAPAPGARSRLGTGHYGQEPGQLTVVPVPASSISGGGGAKARDLANAAPSTAFLGGQYFRVVVLCKEPEGGTESEYEFVFRYGL